MPHRLTMMTSPPPDDETRKKHRRLLRLCIEQFRQLKPCDPMQSTSPLANVLSLLRKSQLYYSDAQPKVMELLVELWIYINTICADTIVAIDDIYPWALLYAHLKMAIDAHRSLFAEEIKDIRNNRGWRAVEACKNTAEHPELIGFAASLKKAFANAPRRPCLRGKRLFFRDDQGIIFCIELFVGRSTVADPSASSSSTVNASPGLTASSSSTASFSPSPPLSWFPAPECVKARKGHDIQSSSACDVLPSSKMHVYSPETADHGTTDDAGILRALAESASALRTSAHLACMDKIITDDVAMTDVVESIHPHSSVAPVPSFPMHPPPADLSKIDSAHIQTEVTSTFLSDEPLTSVSWTALAPETRPQSHSFSQSSVSDADCSAMPELSTVAVPPCSQSSFLNFDPLLLPEYPGLLQIVAETVNCVFGGDMSSKPIAASVAADSDETCPHSVDHMISGYSHPLAPSTASDGSDLDAAPVAYLTEGLETEPSAALRSQSTESDVEMLDADISSAEDEPSQLPDACETGTTAVMQPADAIPETAFMDIFPNTPAFPAYSTSDVMARQTTEDYLGNHAALLAIMGSTAIGIANIERNVSLEASLLDAFQLWQSRREDVRDLSGSICLSVASYRTEDVLSVQEQQASTDFIENLLRPLPPAWPCNGSTYIAFFSGDQRSYVGLSPPWLEIPHMPIHTIPANIKAFDKLGFGQTEPACEYIFALWIHRPNPHQLWHTCAMQVANIARNIRWHHVLALGSSVNRRPGSDAPLA